VAFDDLDLASSSDGTHVILLKSQGEKDDTAAAGARVEESRISIAVTDLVRLIVTHGQPV
jgi:hypothetical protein